MRIFKEHPEVYSFHNELRVLTDSDGLIPLLDSLSSGFTTVRGREALYRFERMMKYDLITPDRTPYKGYDMRLEFGMEYFRLIDEFIARVTAGQSSNKVGHRNYEELFYLSHEKKGLFRRRMMERDYDDDTVYVPKFFENRAELEKIAAQFVDDLFCIPMHRAGKSTWCEKTPNNLQSMLELIRLFPDALFIHIKRDPRGVLQSYMKQWWAPSDLQIAVSLLEQIYRKWFYIKERLPAHANVIEVRLEDLVSKPVETFSRIASKGGLLNEWPAIVKLSDKKANYWRDELSLERVRELEMALGDIIPKMGYPERLL